MREYSEAHQHPRLIFPQFDDNVIGPGNKFDTAYWEIRYVRAYMNDQFSITTTSGGTGEPSQTTTVLEAATPTRSGPTTRTTVVTVQTTVPAESSGTTCIRLDPLTFLTISLPLIFGALLSILR